MACFPKPIHHLVDDSKQKFTKSQEAFGKDIEHRVGVLKESFEMLRHENRGWEKDEAADISDACLVFHNMLVDPSRSGLHGDDGDKKVLMDLFENEVAMFSDIYDVGSADDAADGCNEILFDADEYMDEVIVQESLMTR